MVLTIDELFRSIDSYFLDDAKLKYCELFAEKQRNIEGWFKGELLYLFTRLEKEGVLPATWGYEFKPISAGEKRIRIDFGVDVSSSTSKEEYLCVEVKTIYLGSQKGQNITPSLYFGTGAKNQYVGGDVRRLATYGPGYCLLFVYPFPPDPGLWNNTVDNFIGKMGARDIGIQVEKANALDLQRYDRRLYIEKLYVPLQPVIVQVPASDIGDGKD
jgi:hypothetical protein